MAVVYFVSAHGHDGPIKIGFTTGAVERRLKFLQTGNPSKLRVIETLDFNTQEGAMKIEWMLHQRLRSRRLVGEWFAVTLRQCMEALVSIGDELNCYWESDDPNSPYLDIIPLMQATE